MKKNLLLFFFAGLGISPTLNAQAYSWKTFKSPGFGQKIVDYRMHGDGSGWYAESSSSYTTIDVTNIYFTSDGGKSWNKTTPPAKIDQWETLSQLYFSDNSNGYILFDNNNKQKSRLMKTSDGGGNWDLVCDTIFTDYTTASAGKLYLNLLSRLNFAGKNLIYTNKITIKKTGGTDLLNKFLISNNGGKTFRFVEGPFIDNKNLTIFEIKFYDDNLGYVTCRNNGDFVYKTTDGGYTWTEVKKGSYWFYKVGIADASTVFHSDDQNQANLALLFKSSDAGATWVPSLTYKEKRYDYVYNPTNAPVALDGDIMDVSFFNKNYGIVQVKAGSYGRVYYHTLDGGASWVQDSVSKKSVVGYTTPDILTNIQTPGVGKGFALYKGTLISINGEGITPAGIQDASEEIIKMEMFPNPVTAGQAIHISLKERNFFGSVSLFDVTGKMIDQTDLKGFQEYKLNTGNLIPGIYFVQLRNNKSTVTEKILIH